MIEPNRNYQSRSKHARSKGDNIGAESAVDTSWRKRDVRQEGKTDMRGLDGGKLEAPTSPIAGEDGIL